MTDRLQQDHRSFFLQGDPSGNSPFASARLILASGTFFRPGYGSKKGTAPSSWQKIYRVMICGPGVLPGWAPSRALEQSPCHWRPCAQRSPGPFDWRMQRQGRPAPRPVELFHLPGRHVTTTSFFLSPPPFSRCQSRARVTSSDGCHRTAPQPIVAVRPGRKGRGRDTQLLASDCQVNECDVGLERKRERKTRKDTTINPPARGRRRDVIGSGCSRLRSLVTL